MTKKIYAADLFCGGGGTSSGLALACKELDFSVELLAINHWSTAIETHRRNHPWATHMCANLEALDPRKVVPSGRLDLLVASPECTNHSKARGGRPINDQSRASAWRVLEWADKLYISNILIENVDDFLKWGPINKDTGRPIQARQGEIFDAFIANLRAMNYRVEWRILNAADFGGATTRKRLFIIARKGNQRITWPDPTHSKDAGSCTDLFSKGLKPWRTARDIIDWNIPSESIFKRKKPLARSTIDRVAAGLRKFCGKAAEPFLILLYGTGKARSVERPLPTVTAEGQHIALCEPRFSGAMESGSNEVPQLPAFIIGAGGPEFAARPVSVEAPLGTVLTENHKVLIQPSYIVPTLHGQGDVRSYSTARPLPTITGADAWGLVEPFLVKFYRDTESQHQSVKVPFHTIPTHDRFGLVEPEVAKIGIDIRFRMLQPHELAKAMGFEKYVFTGTRSEQVKQIGNAVEVNVARALCRALLSRESISLKEAA